MEEQKTTLHQKDEDLFIEGLLKKKTNIIYVLNLLKQQEDVFYYLHKIVWNDNLFDEQFHQHMYELQNIIDNIFFWSICLDENLLEYFHHEDSAFFIFDLEEQLNDIIENTNKRICQCNEINLIGNIQQLFQWNDKIIYFQNILAYQLLDRSEHKKIQKIQEYGHHYIKEYIKLQEELDQHSQICFQHDVEIDKLKTELEKENIDEKQKEKIFQKMNQLQKDLNQYRFKLINKKLCNINYLDNQLEYILDLQRKYDCDNTKIKKYAFNFDCISSIVQKNKIKKKKKQLNKMEQKYMESCL